MNHRVRSTHLGSSSCGGGGSGLPWFIARAPGIGLWLLPDCWGVEVKLGLIAKTVTKSQLYSSQTLGSLVSNESLE